MTTTFEFIDTHYHAGADIHPRRLTVEEAAAEFTAAHGAVWLKRHDGETITSTAALRRAGHLVGGTVVVQPHHVHNLPSLTRLLDHSNGPLRPIVSLPTRWTQDFLDFTRTPAGRGYLRELFDVVARADAVLATGHIPAAELPRIFRAGEVTLLRRILVTHAFHPLVDAWESADELRDEFGAVLEHTELTMRLARITLDQHHAILTKQSAVVYASDYGQLDSPAISTWRTQTARTFNNFAISARRCRSICRDNAANLLIRGLAPTD